MDCPICDQKTINCDCTEAERRQFREIEDLEEEIERLRLTDAEVQAVAAAITYMSPVGNYDSSVQNTLRGLLERHCPVPENQTPQENTHQTHSTTAEGRVRHEWIPVTERLPSRRWDGFSGIVVVAAGTSYFLGRYYRCDIGDECHECDADIGERWYIGTTAEPTHWMPLPDPLERHFPVSGNASE